MEYHKKKHFGIKTVVLGNYATGKTTLVERLTTGKIKPFTESTIGCAYSSLTHNSKIGIPIQFQIWDTAGQEKYRALSELYYRNADLILVCFDVADHRSFDNIKIWLDLIDDGCLNRDHIKLLIANKDDLEWKTDQEKVREFACNNNMTLVITSSLQNRGIDQLLTTMLETTETKWRNEMKHFQEHGDKGSIICDNKPLPRKYGCCS